MGNEIKAIETKYKGYRFRSRLEVRWAVFFDALGVEWEYETQGYELPCGRYLPDFYMPRFKTWLEVKAGSFTADERDRCRLLCEATKEQVVMLDGMPDFREYDFFEYHEHEEEIRGFD